MENPAPSIRLGRPVRKLDDVRRFEESGQSPNKQLQRTVTGRRSDAASALFHYALAPRFTPRRAAAELRRYGADAVSSRRDVAAR